VLTPEHEGKQMTAHVSKVQQEATMLNLDTVSSGCHVMPDVSLPVLKKNVLVRWFA
jgi:hypothetical protein